MIDLIKPVITILRKQNHIRLGQKYFSNKQIEFSNIIGMGKNMENFTKSIEKLDRLLILHQFLSYQINFANPIVKPQLKNTTCPISLGDISNEFIECTTCGTCYDYSNTSTVGWFSQHNKCAVCRQQFVISVKHVGGENVLYNQLKKNAKNT